tara:strand:+ start:77 stop:586 length:510 start_codon:yes stop_codon:yes gene_type:complete
MKFVLLSEEEEVDFFHQINSHFPLEMYKIVKHGLASGIWKRISQNPNDRRYVYLNLRFQKNQEISIKKAEIQNRLSMCIGSDFENIAIILCSHSYGIKNILYFPKALTPDWVPFWNAFQNDCADIRNHIISLYFFNKSIECDPLKQLYLYLLPKWSLRILHNNFLLKKN